jgi:ComF family protein
MGLFDFAAHIQRRAFPRGLSVCSICQAWPAQAICSACIERFAQPLVRCPICALPGFAHACPSCLASPPAWDQAFCAVGYGYPWDACVARLKFSGDSASAVDLAHVMQHAPGVEPALEWADAVLPMPLSKERLRERGFNQALELARHLSPGKTIHDGLLRIRHTPTQASLPRAERLGNLAGTMVVHPAHASALQHRRVVLIDDVMTTGSSLQTAALALRQVGVRHITALVFARTDAPQPTHHPGHFAVGENPGHVSHRPGPA